MNKRSLRKSLVVPFGVLVLIIYFSVIPYIVGGFLNFLPIVPCSVNCGIMVPLFQWASGVFSIWMMFVFIALMCFGAVMAKEVFNYIFPGDA